MMDQIKQELISRLQKIQENLRTNKEIGIKKLEQLSTETKSSFDRAINSLDLKINILNELRIRRDHLRLWRISYLKTIFPINFKYVLTIPFIYGMIIPGIFFHIGLEIYHQVCFRIYGIPRVKPNAYFIYDRRLLPYLNWLEKLNCIYCSYFNNLLQYAVEIAGRTERYWCPIKYATRVTNTHSQYDKFVDYLDAENFREKWQELRNFSDIEQIEQTESKPILKEKNEECDFVKNKKI